MTASGIFFVVTVSGDPVRPSAMNIIPVTNSWSQQRLEAIILVFAPC